MNNPKLNILFLPFITFALLFALNEALADPLHIGSDGHCKDPTFVTKYASLNEQIASPDQFQSAQAEFLLGEMLIDGYYEDALLNAEEALAHYQHATDKLRELPKDARYFSQGVSADVLQTLKEVRLAAINRLTAFYTQSVYGVAIQVSHRKVDQAKALQKSILGEQSAWYTTEERAAANFQLAQLNNVGTKSYFKYLERAAALGHAKAYTTLAKYSENRAKNLRSVLEDEEGKDPAFNPAEEAFINFVFRHGEGQAKKAYLLQEDRGQYLSYALGRLIKQETNHSAARTGALKKQNKIVPKGAYTQEAEHLKRKVQAFESFSLRSLASLYEEESIDLYKKAAELGDTDICLMLSKKHLSLAEAEAQSRQEHEGLAFYYFQLGAKYNDPLSYILLGRAYENGQGTEKDEKKALDCFLTAHALGGLGYKAKYDLERLQANVPELLRQGYVTFEGRRLSDEQ